MRLPLSNGCYIDPCNPALLYDKPEETHGKEKSVRQKSLEERVIELEKKLSQNPSYTIDDSHIRER